MKPPAFQFYADDFIGGTCDLSAEEVGAYIRLLCYQWNKGSIPTEDANKLTRIAGTDVSQDVLAKFPKGKNARLEEVRQKQEEFRENRSQAGKAGAERRWHSHSTANGSAMAQPMANRMAKHSSPSPTPSPRFHTAGTGQAGPAMDGLFEALSKTEGSDPSQLTKAARGKVTEALRQIIKAYPAVTADEIAARAVRYRKVMPRGSVLTVMALAKHWARCGDYRPKEAVPVVEEGPHGWRDRLEAIYPGNRINAEGLAFSHVSEDIRSMIA